MYEADLNIASNIQPVMFSRKQLFSYDSGEEDRQIISRFVSYLSRLDCDIAICGNNELSKYLMKLSPEFSSLFKEMITIESDMGNIPENIGGVFICETNWRAIDKIKKLLPESLHIVTLDTLLDYDWQAIPNRAWVNTVEHIYPIEIPEIEFHSDQDMILLDLPARSISQLPVGFGYVHDALKKENISLQTVDLDIIIYHRYHSDRLLDGMSGGCTQEGYKLPEDPWQPVHYLEWEKDDFVDYFQPDIDELVEKLSQAKPKIIGCSIQQVNRAFTQRLVQELKKRFDFTLIVGGMSCLHADAAKIVFPDADFIVVGEADLTIGPLVHSILKGETPKDVPGVWSRFDTPGRIFTEGRLPQNLDEFGHPRFEWTDLDLYRNWDGYRLAPIVGSRGCQWAKCSFCGERFKWRTRSPEKIVDDIEFFSKRGFSSFVFNESDLHGDTRVIEKMCDEILKRNINAQFTAQLRCNTKAGLSYYQKLKKAGFGCLRFGVDGWSKNSLKIQKKGYTKDAVRHTLKNTKEAGLFTEVNIVVGVPGETDEDVNECIDFLIEMKPYIGRVAFINPFMLFRGSDYWSEPDKNRIRYTMDKQELYATYPVAVPDKFWHSVEPFMDAGIRYERFKKIVKALHENGFAVTDWFDFTDNQVNKKVESIQGERESDKRADDALPFKTYRGYRLVSEDDGLMAYPVEGKDHETASMNRAISNDVIRAATIEGVWDAIDAAVDPIDNNDDFLVFRVEEHFIAVYKEHMKSDIQSLRFYENPAKQIQPLLLENYKGHNIVAVNGCIFIVSVMIGKVNLGIREGREKEGVHIALSVAHARQIVDELLEN